MEFNTYVYLIKRAITFQNFPNSLYICYTKFFFSVHATYRIRNSLQLAIVQFNN